MKKTILQINIVCGVGSTGRIAVDLANALNQDEYNVYIAYGYGKSKLKNTIKIGTKIEYIIHNILSRITGKQGRFSWFATKRFLKRVDKIRPDIIHLHNIHGNYINYSLLFKYIKKHDIPVVWTMHDTWPITGKCTHFDYAKCAKWKDGCKKCPILKEYPSSIIDSSKSEYNRKKQLFASIDNLVIVTPSQWLANIVKQSFLKNKEIIVINNGIDLNKFKPIKESNFRIKFNIEDKILILGVANNWNYKKGLSTFVDLSKKLPNNYRIILVGLEKSQMKILPDNIIKIEKTNSIEQLAEIYSSANFFINPTLEDNFPTTNIEALACGTPVITYNTGGSPEIIDENTGVVVEKGNINMLEKTIKDLKVSKFNKEFCLERAKLYNKNKQFKQYGELYNKILEGKK